MVTPPLTLQLWMTDLHQVLSEITHHALSDARALAASYQWAQLAKE